MLIVKILFRMIYFNNVILKNLTDSNGYIL